MSAAPGAPGLPPTWCSSAKEMVGCSLGSSRLWFTVGGGIVNEVYFPRIDVPQIRDLGFIVADGCGFWVEVKRMWKHELQLVAPGTPAVHVVHRHERFELALRIVPCEHRDVLLVEVSLSGDPSLTPYVLLAPHLGGTGAGNFARVAQCRGRRALVAEQGPYALALLAITPEQGAPGASAPATAGRTSRTTARSPGATTVPGLPMSRSPASCRATRSSGSPSPAPRKPPRRLRAPRSPSPSRSPGSGS